MSNLPIFLAIDAGLFAARGLAIEVLRPDEFAATAAQLRRGKAAAGTTGFTQVLADADDPDPLVVVAGSGIRGMGLVGRPGATLASLSGPVGSFADDPMRVLLEDVLETRDLAGRIGVRPMASLPEAADALRSGQVEAVTMVEPWIASFVAEGFALLSDGTDVWGPVYPDTVLVVRRSRLNADPEAVTSVIAAMLAAERLILADPDGALRAVAHRFASFSLPELRAGLRGQPPRIDLRGLDDAILDRWTTVRRLAGSPPAPIPSGLIDFRCLAAAIVAEPTSPSSKGKAHVH